jgi:hypothetical protein
MNVWYIHHARMEPDARMVLQTIPVFVLMVIQEGTVAQKLMNVFMAIVAYTMVYVLMD